MGYQDRDYSRGYRPGYGVWYWILSGRVSLFRVAGIDVQAHSSLIIYGVIGLLIGVGRGFDWRDRLISVGALFLIVLLHEFGHCLTCRRVGGEADEIVMHPFGGLAMCRPPRRPLPTFLTVAGGPGVNVLICIVTGAVIAAVAGFAAIPGNPFNLRPAPFSPISGVGQLAFYCYWIYQMSWSLLVFNLLPIFPLDGGQMVQAALWPYVGYYKSMKHSTEVGMFAAVACGAFALANAEIGLAVLAMFGFYACYVMRQQLLVEGANDFEAVTYAAGPEPRVRIRKKSWLAERRERLAKEAEVNEAAAVDRILEKVAQSGMHSLSTSEKRTLEKASENQRKRDAARAKRY